MPRTTRLGPLVLVLASAGWLVTANAIASADTDAILDRAIKAHGGAKALEKLTRMVRKSAGKMSLFGQELQFSADMITDLPARFRLKLNIDAGGQKSVITVVLNGDQAWQASGGMTLDVPRNQVNALKQEAYLLWLTTLIPLRTDRSITLAAAAATMVDGKKADGLTVARKGNADVTLYFDRDTGLLVKAAHRVTESGGEVLKEYVYRDHKSVDNLKLPRRSEELSNGRKLTDIETITYSLPDRVDEKDFSKP